VSEIDESRHSALSGPESAAPVENRVFLSQGLTFGLRSYLNTKEINNNKTWKASLKKHTWIRKMYKVVKLRKKRSDRTSSWLKVGVRISPCP
jgi:hypothetical protein